jgi:DNA-binding transcriptional MocR family regulator
MEKIDINRNSRVPLFLQIRDQIKDQILNDILQEGKRLPPSRELARILGVNRGTVVAAYNELEAEDYVESQVGRGTIVKRKTHIQVEDYNHQPMNWAEYFSFFPRTSTYYLHKDRERDQISLFTHEDVISFGTGIPDPKFYPAKELKKIISTLLMENGETMLQLAPVEGCYPLRKMLADWITQEGRYTRPEEILITSGSNQGLYLAVHTLLNPNDLVVVENPTSMNALRIFQAAEAQLIDIPIDENGMRVDIFENVLSRRKVKLVYTVPTFQNPSGTVLSIERRKKLLDIAYKYHVPIVEDDPYRMLYFKDTPPLSLKALDAHDIVIHLGTFSKVLFPGLRIGWVIAPKPVIKQMTPAKQLVDLHSNTLDQYAFFEFCTQGFLEKHLQKLRPIYKKKRDILLTSLSKCCSSTLSWNMPAGGFYLWASLNNHMNSQDLFREAVYEKVIFVEGNTFSPNENCEDRLRLSFSFLDITLIEEGVKRLSRAINKLKKRDRLERRKEISSTKPMI